MTFSEFNKTYKEGIKNQIKASDLIKNQIYIDVSDKLVPLKFTGKKSKLINIGFNTYVYECTFEVITTNKNKNWVKNMPKFRVINFCEFNGCSYLRKQ